MASRHHRGDQTPGDDPTAAGTDGDTATGTPATPDRAPTSPWRVLDGRTLAACALVALAAALVAGLVVSRFTATDEAAGAPGQTGLTLAEEVPDVALTRFDGTEVSLADYRGQPLVVNFWGAWCQPCVEEMPDLQAVHTSLGDQVTFVGVNVRDAPEAAQAMAERTGVTYDLVRDVDGDLGRALEVTTWPTTVLVLPDGTVVETLRSKVSAARLCEKINQSLLGGRVQECG